jgi:sugar phosphate isomerase/epimerase
MDNASRFVFSGPGGWPLEQAIEKGVELGFSRVHFNADAPPNFPETFTPERIKSVKSMVADHGIDLGIHTLSAVNMAEITPAMAAGADEYVRQNIALTAALGGTHLVIHGGFHFTTDLESRFAAAVERLKLALRLAADAGVELHFENRYMPHNVAEYRRFWDALAPSAPLRWACNIGHAMLVPEGFAGFLAAFGADTIGHVRLHDTNGLWEEHFKPGENGGIIDFRQVFTALHHAGFRGPFTLDFGSPEEKGIWRERWGTMLDEIEAAG